MVPWVHMIVMGCHDGVAVRCGATMLQFLGLQHPPQAATRKGAPVCLGLLPPAREGGRLPTCPHACIHRGLKLGLDE